MSTDILQAHRWPPASAIIWMNSGTSGTSRLCICFFIMRVATAVIPGSPAMPCGMWNRLPGGCIAVLPIQVNCRSFMCFLVIGVEPPEREEDVGLDTLHERRVRHDERRVDHVEGALGGDEADLAIGVVVAEVGDHGVVVVSVMVTHSWCLRCAVIACALIRARCVAVGDSCGRVRRSRGAWAHRRCRPSSWRASSGTARTASSSARPRRSTPDAASGSRRAP